MRADLEKNQHYVAAQLAAGRPVASISGGTHRVLETAAGDALAAGRAAVDGLKQRVPPPPTADDVPPAYETLTAGREARVPGAM
jgi:putative intracellular protease/amidase